MDIVSIDHLVLTVASVDRSVAWYASVLGLRHVNHDGRHALHFGAQKVNLHEVGHTFEPKAAHPTPGAADLCFVSATPVDAVIETLREHHVDIVTGPVERVGARGSMTSVYVRDPDQNLIEISFYR